jgi:hypothetical protein
LKKARHRLRDNIRRLIEIGAVPYTAWLASGAVTNGAMSRIVGPDGQNVRIDQLDLLAEALGVEPWQLLHPDIEVSTLSRQAMKIALEMDSLKPEARDAAYALFVQQVEFGNVRQEPRADVPNGHVVPRPRPLRKVHR